MLRRLVLAFALLALLASAAWTQTPVPERRVFAVSVLDSSGKPLEGRLLDSWKGLARMGWPMPRVRAALDLYGFRADLVAA